jgi:ribonuclease HI
MEFDSDKYVNELIVFTDGSCSKNGKKNSTGGFGIYFQNSNLKNYWKECKNGKITNQRMELYAILKALLIIWKNKTYKDYEQIHIYSDSLYSIKCATSYLKTWIKNGFKASNGEMVKNKDIIMLIYKIMLYYKKVDTKIKFIHVKSHTGKKDWISKGNDEADKLAKKYRTK